MNTNQPSPGQFYDVAEDGRYRFWFDSHTLQGFSQCEQFFYQRNVSHAPQQLHLKGPTRACISIGTWWSRVSELFYKKIAAAGNATIFDILQIAARSWVESDMDEMARTQPDKYDKFAIPIRAGEFAKYINGGEELMNVLYKEKAAKFRELGQDDKAREIESRVALPLGPLLMAAQYYQAFAERDIQDWKVIAAEAPFGRHGEVVIGETDKVIVYWQGKPDLVIYEEKSGVLAPLDQKTKDYIPYNVEVIWKPHNQLAGYIYAIQQIASDLGYTNANIDRCIVSVCGRLRPAEPRTKGARPKPRFVRVRPHYSQAEIAEWCRGILYKAERLRSLLELGAVPESFVRNEMACHLYSGCEYRGLCSRPKDVRPLIEKSDFVIQDAWTPFEEED